MSKGAGLKSARRHIPLPYTNHKRKPYGAGKYAHLRGSAFGVSDSRPPRKFLTAWQATQYRQNRSL
jgi:hypothetical protein